MYQQKTISNRKIQLSNENCMVSGEVVRVAGFKSL